MKKFMVITVRPLLSLLLAADSFNLGGTIRPKLLGHSYLEWYMVWNDFKGRYQKDMWPTFP